MVEIFSEGGFLFSSTCISNVLIFHKTQIHENKNFIGFEI
jgi:hypothetical protein